MSALLIPPAPAAGIQQALARLRARRVQLRAVLEAQLHDDGLERHSEAALPRRSAETDDDAAAETQRSADLENLARLYTELAQVESALARAASGQYGACIECDEPIGSARLIAHPAALRCAECQEYAEKTAQHVARTRHG